MTENVEKANTLMERIAQRTGMTDPGKNWLIAALDPCHDGPIECTGYPDAEDAPSVLEVVKSTYAISTPYVSGQTWGFHARLDDYLEPNTMVGQFGGSSSPAWQQVEGNLLGVNTTSGTNPQDLLPYGGFQVLSFDQTDNGTTNVTTTPFSPGVNDNKQLIFDGPDAASFLPGKTRVIGAAFELVNTTAQLYKGGSLLVYEQPCSKEDPQTFIVTTTTPTMEANYHSEVEGRRAVGAPASPKCGASGARGDPKLLSSRGWETGKDDCTGSSGGIKSSRLPDAPVVRTGVLTATWDVTPPISLTEAMLLPGSQQWDASKGCYVVQTMSQMDNSASFCTTEISLKTSIEPLIPAQEATPTPTKALFYRPQFTASAVDPTKVVFPYNKKSPYNTKGVIVSGLTPQSTFTANVVWIIERVISSQDKVLCVLAKPSPPIDNVALSLYSEIVNKIPLGVEFRDNGLGDWFLGVADEIAGVVSTIGRPIMAAVDMYRDKRKKKAKKAAERTVNASGATYNNQPSYGSPMNVDLGDRKRSPEARKRQRANKKERKAKENAERSIVAQTPRARPGPKSRGKVMRAPS